MNQQRKVNRKISKVRDFYFKMEEYVIRELRITKLTGWNLDLTYIRDYNEEDLSLYELEELIKELRHFKNKSLVVPQEIEEIHDNKQKQSNILHTETKLAHADSLDNQLSNKDPELDSEEETNDEVDYYEGEPVCIDPLEIIERIKMVTHMMKSFKNTISHITTRIL